MYFTNIHQKYKKKVYFYLPKMNKTEGVIHRREWKGSKYGASSGNNEKHLLQEEFSCIV